MKSTATQAKHSSENGEHVTPLDVASRVRSVLGVVELDPASDELANTVIQAKRIYTKADDGLSKKWKGRVFLNPPGGKIDNVSQPKLWWEKLARAWLAGDVECAIFIAFSVELFQTSQSINEHEDIDKPDCPVPLDFPFCIPSRRLRFLHPEGGKLVPGQSPTHANAIIYLPSRRDHRGLDFQGSFENLGEVRL